MSVFLVDDSGDLVRDRAGFVRTSGLDSIRQDITVSLRLFRGEVPTRTDKGVDWWGLFSAGVTEAAVAQAVGEDVVLTRPGVVSVDDMDVDLGGEARSATVSYRATVNLADQRRRLVLVEEVSVTL